MKIFLILSLLLLTSAIFSQEEPSNKGGTYYKFSFATTLTLNENFEKKQEGEEYKDRVFAGKTFLRLSAYFFETSIGYQFGQRAALGVNLGYHYHSEQGLHFIPAYLNARINFSDKEDSFFLRGGFGKLIGIGSNFESGTYSKVGLGIQTQKIGLIGLEFNYKEIGFRDLEGLESISLFLEYILF
jgi:hypothetical protein